MKTLTIKATDEPVMIRLVDSSTGNPIVEKAFFPGEVHDFIVEDGIMIQTIEELTPPPPETLGG